MEHRPVSELSFHLVQLLGCLEVHPSVICFSCSSSSVASFLITKCFILETGWVFHVEFAIQFSLSLSSSAWLLLELGKARRGRQAWSSHPVVIRILIVVSAQWHDTCPNFYLTCADATVSLLIKDFQSEIIIIFLPRRLCRVPLCISVIMLEFFETGTAVSVFHFAQSIFWNTSFVTITLSTYTCFILFFFKT